jgi:predicted ATPase/signal transduction histidine kinase
VDFTVLNPVISKKYAVLDSYEPTKSGHLIGRKTEHSQLLEKLSNASHGAVEAILMSGEAGTGKSFLARSLIPAAQKLGGLFVSGKCDQFHLNSPYQAIIEFISDIVDQISLLPPIEINEYKKELTAELGYAAPIVLRMIPKLSHLLDNDIEAQREYSFEFDSTFEFAIIKCIEVFAIKKSPLTILIDDIQWLDNSSVAILTKILKTKAISNIFIIFCYRGSEVASRKSIDEFIESHAASLDTIRIGDFDVDQLRQYLDFSFGSTVPKTDTLANLIHQKTKGNPFFVAQFSKLLIQKKILVKDTNTDVWLWTLDAINRIAMSDNAAKFIGKEVLNLPKDEQEILKIMSCIGGSISDVLISDVVERDNINITLEALCEKGFIIDLSQEHKYRFSHDRIQRGAFDALTEDEVTKLHWKIALAYIKRDDKRESTLAITIVSHLNKGISHCDTAVFLQNVIIRNMDACDAAILQIAYEDALGYIQFAINLVNKNEVKLAYEVELDLYLKAAKVSELAGRFETMESYLNKFNEIAKDTDKVKSLETKISGLIKQNKYDEAYITFRDAVEAAGVSMPKSASKMMVIREFITTEISLSRVGIKNIKNLPKIQDENKKTIARLFSTALPTFYLFKTDILPVYITTWVRFTIKEGLTQETAEAFAIYSVILCGRLGKIARSNEIAELALNLADNNDVESYSKYRVYTNVNNAVRHLKHHFRDFYDITDLSFDRALQFGDHEMAGFNASARCYFEYEAGAQLDEVIETIDSYTEKLKPISENQTLDQYYRLHYRVSRLKDIDDKYRNHGAVDYDAEWSVVDKTLEDRGLTLYTVRMDRSMFCYFDDEYIQSFDIGSKALYELWNPSSPAGSNIAFYTFLSGVKLLEDPGKLPFPKKYIKKIMNKCLSEIKRFNHFKHGTNNHRELTLRALSDSINSKYERAEKRFIEAISYCELECYLTDLGVIKELYARFLMKYKYLNPKEIESHLNLDDFLKGKIQHVLEDALISYEKWGATLLSKKLLTRYRDLFGFEHINVGKKELSADDYQRVLNSLDDIHEYNSLDECLNKIGILFQKLNDDPSIVVLGYKNDGEWQQGFSFGVEESDDWVPISALHRAENTKESIFVQNASIEPGVSQDRFIQQNKIVSYYGVSLVIKKQIIGFIFVGFKEKIEEDSRALQRIQLISGQAASVLENAILIQTVQSTASRYREVYQSSPLGMFSLDDSGFVISINVAMQSFINGWFGTSVVEGVNAFITEWCDEIGAKEFIKRMVSENIVQDKTDLSLIVRGKEVYLQVVCVCVGSKNTPNFDFSITDNTEVINHEKEVRNRVQAENKVKASESFVANVSHELRTPLSVIVGSCKQALKSEEELDENVKRVINTTLRNGQRLFKFVDDLLEFASDSNRAKVMPKSIDFSSLMNEVAESMMLSIGSNRKINIRIENKLIINANGDDITRIGFNIVNNAFKFTNEDEGEIEISLESIDGNGVLIIKDNGIGISSEDQPFIFDRFYQSNTKREVGAGIGLSLVKEMVDRNNGTVSVHSQVGVGSTFTVYFPLIMEEVKTDWNKSFNDEIKEREIVSLENELRRQISNRKSTNDLEFDPTIEGSLNDSELNISKAGFENSILIVDDEVEIRNYLSESLRKDFNLYEAVDGNDALNKIVSKKPALILLDMMMPNMDGIETLVKLKEFDSFEAKIIVLSANNNQDLINKALSLGADDFIEKQVDMTELITRCRNLIGNYNIEQSLKLLNEELTLQIENRKQSETKLLVAQKSASTSHLSKSLLHELNNPINISLQSINYIGSVIDSGMNEDNLLSTRSALQDVTTMQRRMVDILSDLRAYTSEDNATKKNESILDIVNRAVSLNKYDLAGIEVQNDCEDLQVFANKSQIMQVLTNLFSNSKKAFFSSKSDRIFKISISTKKSDDGIEVIYRDNGPGIEKKDLSNIFKTSFSKFGLDSSGYGLSICQELLKNHKSCIVVDSNGENYAEFKFVLESTLDIVNT